MSDNADDVMGLYIKDIYKIPRLSRKLELELATRAKSGDTQARNRLVVSHLRFVVSVAKAYQCPGLELSDLVSEGNIGLLKAVKTFDPERGILFLSYAVWWIRQSILKAIQQKSRLIRIPLNRVAELSRIEKAQNKLREVSGDEPDLRELAASLNLEPEYIQSLLAVANEVTSLDRSLDTHEGDGRLIDLVVSADETPEESFSRAELKANIDRMLTSLSEREADILRSRFGLNNRQPKSLRFLAERHRVTKERIRQLEKKALKHLRAAGYWDYFDGMQLV